MKLSNTSAHRMAMRHVIEELERRQIRARMIPTKGGEHDEIRLPDGRVVYVRGARQHRKPHNVQVGGKRYYYVYRCIGFALHWHGLAVTPRPAIWCLVDLTARTVFVVPGQILRDALTVYMQCGPVKGRRPSRIRPYWEAWNLLEAA